MNSELYKRSLEIDNEIEKLIDEKLKLGVNDLELTERKLFKKIYCEGKKPTKAINELSDENYLGNITPYSPRSLWRIYNSLKRKMK